MNIDNKLDIIGKRFAIYKTRFNRFRVYLGMLTIANTAILIKLWFKFDSIKINFESIITIMAIILILIIIYLFMWFDKRYVHKYELDYNNSKNPFIKQIFNELNEIKRILRN